MRLFEIFEDVANPVQVKQVADLLDKKFYQPADEIKKNRPVLDVEIPTSAANHFIQRYNERSDVAKFSLRDVYQLLARAKKDPSLGYADSLEDLARENYPLDTVVLQDKDKLTIPVIVKPNPKCVKMTDGNPVCVTRNGTKEPKNQLIPKTIYRKGVNDAN